jgi:hypothetical protein
MAQSELLTVEEAAALVGLKPSTLYARIRRARARKEATPFARRKVSGRVRLMAERQALLEWAAPDRIERRRREEATPEPTSARRAVIRDDHMASRMTTAVHPSIRESSTGRELVAREPAVTAGAPAMTELPDSYMEDRVVAMPRHPDGIVAYWDVSPETAAAFVGSRWGLAVASPGGERTIEVQNGARNWYVEEQAVATHAEVAFGPLDGNGRVVAVARDEYPPRHESNPGSGRPEWGRGVIHSDGKTALAPVKAFSGKGDADRLREASRATADLPSSASSVPERPHQHRRPGASDALVRHRRS